MRNRVVALACLLCCLLVTAATGLFATGSAAGTTVRSKDVTISVDSIEPASSPRTTRNRPLVVTLTLTNHTGTAVKNVRVVGYRGRYTITTQSALTSSLAARAAVNTNDLTIDPVTPVKQTVPPDGSITVTFATTTSIQNDAGVCACADAVYPLLFSAVTTGADGADLVLDSARTYLPLFAHTLPKLQVGWVWPLLDRPHRLTSDTVFEDDDLAASVAGGGRLDRALGVVEQVAPQVPVTLLLDPETIDELQVMSTTDYRVRSTSSQSTVAGTGRSAAADWLLRLRTVLTDRPDDQVVFTPYADPDVQTLSLRGRTWRSTLPSAMAQRVDTALGSTVVARTDVALPAASRISPATLTALARTGVRTVILDSDTVRTGAGADTGPPGAVTLSGGGSMTALLTDPRIEKLLASAVTPNGSGAAGLPTLLAQLATRVTSTPQAARATVLTVPRYVDASVPDAVRTIDATSTASFASPVSLTRLTALDDVPRTPRSLRPLGSSEPVLRRSVTAGIASVRSATPSITSLLTVDAATARRESPAQLAAAKATLEALPVTVQRLQSSAWRTDSGVQSSVSDRFGAIATDYVDRIQQGVHIVIPSTRVYTLASTNSDLPITVQNDLPYPVSIVLDVSTVNGVPGLTTKSLGTQTIGAGSPRMLRVQTTVERPGRIQIQVELSAPDDSQIGAPLTLTVHSTALGRIGVIITITAGALLVLALLVRTLRWGRRRARRGRGQDPDRTVLPVGAAT